MDQSRIELRHRAAARVLAFNRRELNLSVLMHEFSACSDRDVNDLLDLVEHEPPRGGFLGASEQADASHMNSIEELIAKLAGRRRAS